MPIPENDYLDDLIDVFRNNKSPYIIVYVDQKSGAGRVVSDVDNWLPANPDVSVKEDILQMLDVTIFNTEGEDE